MMPDPHSSAASSGTARREENHREDHYREELCHVGRLLYERGLIGGTDGNLSVRLPDGNILITAAGMSKAWMVPADGVVVNLDGELLRASGERRPSSEQVLHLEIYRHRPDVRAVVHAHPPTAVGATLAGVSMENAWDRACLPEVLLYLGRLPTAAYALTGTPEMFEAIRPLIAKSDAMLLSHHGALTVGRDLMQAFLRMDQIEHAAKILLSGHLFGGVVGLPPERTAEIKALRDRKFP